MSFIEINNVLNISTFLIKIIKNIFPYLKAFIKNIWLTLDMCLLSYQYKICISHKQNAYSVENPRGRLFVKACTVLMVQRQEDV